MLKYLGVMGHQVNNCSQMVQEKELFVLFLQLFGKFEIISKEKEKVLKRY